MSMPPVALRTAGFLTVHFIARYVGVVSATARKWFETTDGNGARRPIDGVVDMPAGSQRNRYYIPEKVAREVLARMNFPAAIIDGLIEDHRAEQNGTAPKPARVTPGKKRGRPPGKKKPERERAARSRRVAS